jgi:hypothetical protein
MEEADPGWINPKRPPGGTLGPKSSQAPMGPWEQFYISLGNQLVTICLPQ